MHKSPQTSFEIQQSHDFNHNDFINLRKLIHMVFRNWYFILISIILAGGGSYAFIRYTIPTYHVTSSILIQEDQAPGVLETDRILTGFGLSSGSDNLYNQMLILKSWNVINRTLNELPFQIDYYTKGLIYKILLPLDIYSHKRCAKVVTVFPKMGQYLTRSRRLQYEIMEVIPNWQDSKRFTDHKKSIIPRDKDQIFTYMFLGNLSPTAAINDMITAFSTAKLSSSRFIIAGSGSMKDSLKEIAMQCEGVEIEFWDAPMDQVPEIQENADVLILDLLKRVAQFALPSKLASYMLSGKPIIACVEQSSDTANYINEANCGWIVPSEDANALSDLMQKIASVPRMTLTEYGENGFKFAQENSSKESNPNKFVSIIGNTIT